MSEEETSTQPSGALAGLAALMPTLFLTAGCLLIGAVAIPRGGISGVVHMIQETGFSFYGVLLATMVAWLAITVLLFLSGKGFGVPAAVTLAVASLPWLVGVGGTFLGMRTALDAIESADASIRAMLMAAGIAEATNARLLGAILSSSLLASVAFGLAIAAHAQRPERRSVIGAAVGLVAAVPLLGLAMYGALAGWRSAFTLVLAGLGAVVASAIAGGGVGVDEPRGRSGPMATGAILGATLAVVSAAVASSSVALIEVFSALANADPSSRATMIGAAAMELLPLSRAAMLGLPVGLLAVGAVGAWAFTRRRPSPMQLAGAGAALVAAGLIVGADSWVIGSVADDAVAATELPWQDQEGLEPVRFDDDLEEGAVDGIITAQGLVRPDGTPVTGFDAATLRTGLAALARDRPQPPPAPDWLRPRTADAADPLHAPADLVLALDRRLTAAQLRTLLAAAEAAELRALTLVGEPMERPSAEMVEAVRDALPMLAIGMTERSSVRVVLGGAVPEGRAAADPDLHHVRVGAEPAAQTEVRNGAMVPEHDRDLMERRWDRDEQPPLYLGFSDQATAGSIVVTAVRSARAGFVPVLVSGAIPGSPDRSDESGALGALFGDDLRGGTGEGTIGLGNLGTIGSGAGAGDGGGFAHAAAPGQPPRIRTGSADVRGSLSREVIRRVIRRHLNEVRFCYEQGLARDPTLAGRVNVGFIISPTGAVQSSAVRESTLGDPGVEGCIVRAVRRWSFPAPDGGGIVAVTYPFVLSSSG